jgi:hypothetical protein
MLIGSNNYIQSNRADQYYIRATKRLKDTSEISEAEQDSPRRRGAYCAHDKPPSIGELVDLAIADKITVYWIAIWMATGHT